jgi:hypothetical protein
VLGAEAREVTWPDGASWYPRVPSVTGLIVDLRGRVVPGARVWMTGLPDTVVTDSMGVFRLPRPMGGGLFRVVAADSVLAAASINQTPPYTLSVSDDRNPSTDIDVDVLKMYPRTDALSAICPDGNYRPGTGVAVVRATDSSGVTARDGHVEMETLQRVVVGDTVLRVVHRSGEVGSRGSFVVCGASLDQPMKFLITRRAERGEGRIEHWTGEVMVLTIVLHPGAP